MIKNKKVTKNVYFMDLDGDGCIMDSGITQLRGAVKICKGIYVSGLGYGQYRLHVHEEGYLYNGVRYIVEGRHDEDGRVWSGLEMQFVYSELGMGPVAYADHVSRMDKYKKWANDKIEKELEAYRHVLHDALKV